MGQRYGDGRSHRRASGMVAREADRRIVTLIAGHMVSDSANDRGCGGGGHLSGCGGGGAGPVGRTSVKGSPAPCATEPVSDGGGRFGHRTRACC